MNLIDAAGRAGERDRPANLPAANGDGGSLALPDDDADDLAGLPAGIGDLIPLHWPTRYGPTAAEAGCSCPSGAQCDTPGKHPRISGWEAPDYHTKPWQPPAWRRSWPQMNVGVRPAPGLLVLDVDDEAVWEALRAGRPVPNTLTMRSGRAGGAHYWWSVPPELTLRRRTFSASAGIDVRYRASGQVVVPPSRHYTGRAYTWDDPAAPIAAAPQWLVDELLADNTSRDNTSPVDAAELPAHLRHRLQQPILRADGERDRSREIWRVCCLCAWHDYPLETARALVAADPVLASKLEGRRDDYVGDAYSKALRSVQKARREQRDLDDVLITLVGSQRSTSEPASASTAVQEAASSSWRPEDLSAFIDGDPEPIEPCLWEREDGLMLLYPGRVHAILGETESGKSFVMHALIADVLRRGGRVCLIDYESVATTVIPRIKSMGVSGQRVHDGLWYLRPDTSPFATSANVAAWDVLCTEKFDLIVLDGVNEALATMALSMLDNDEVTRWERTIPRKLAEQTGAPVVLIDHVTKNADNRGRFAIGAQAKLATLGGVAYMLEVVRPLGQGMRGELLMWIGKDREGAIRPRQIEYNPKTRLGKIATVIIDSTGARTYVTLYPPKRDPVGGVEQDPTASGLHKLSPLMEDISRALLESMEAGNKTPKKTELLQKVHANKGNVADAFARLQTEGYLSIRTQGNAKYVSLVRPYWQAEVRQFAAQQPGQGVIPELADEPN